MLALPPDKPAEQLLIKKDIHFFDCNPLHHPLSVYDMFCPGAA
ncbi:hypothetical protein [Erwinia tasmaniensis]